MLYLRTFLFTLLISFCTSLQGYSQEVFIDKTFDEMFVARSLAIYTTRENNYKKIVEQFDELNYKISNNKRIAEEVINGEYDISKEQIQGVRDQGVATDINVGVQALTSGDALVGGMTAAFGLWNAIDRNKLLKEKAREDKLAYEKAKRETDRLVDQALKKTSEQKLIKLSTYYAEIRNPMNACPYYSNTEIKFPLRKPGSNNELYFFATIPLYDVIFVSQVIRMDFYDDETWLSFAHRNMVKNINPEIIIQNSPDLRKNLKAASKTGDFKFPQEKTLYSDIFFSKEEAIVALKNYISSVVDKSNVPIFPFISKGNLEKEQITNYLNKSDSYWNNEFSNQNKTVNGSLGSIGNLKYQNKSNNLQISLNLVAENKINIITTSNSDILKTGLYAILSKSKLDVVKNNEQYFIIDVDKNLIYNDEFGQIVFTK